MRIVAHDILDPERRQARLVSAGSRNNSNKAEDSWQPHFSPMLYTGLVLP